MNYGAIKTCDIANGIGVRTVLFVSGCTNRCEGCFQPETWDFSYGKPFTRETEDELIRSCRPAYINGLTLLGGDPMEPSNQRALVPFLHRFRRECPGKTVWCFTGFCWEELTGKESRPRCETSPPHCEVSHPRCEVTDEMLSLIDVLVDGRFVLAKKDISLRFRGSSNQRILDVKRSLAEGKPILWGEPLSP